MTAAHFRLRRIFELHSCGIRPVLRCVSLRSLDGNIIHHLVSRLSVIVSQAFVVWLLLSFWVTFFKLPLGAAAPTRLILLLKGRVSKPPPKIKPFCRATSCRARERRGSCSHTRVETSLSLANASDLTWKCDLKGRLHGKNKACCSGEDNAGVTSPLTQTNSSMEPVQRVDTSCFKLRSPYLRSKRAGFFF